MTAKIGAEITGVSLEEPFDDSGIERVVAALKQYKVLVFPDQVKVGPHELLAFATQFTTPEMDGDPGLVHPDIVPGVRMTITDGTGFTRLLNFLFEQTQFPECQLRVSWRKGAIAV
jgi:alpha-ketoglutarate-dependent taurine dioxygenase